MANRFIFFTLLALTLAACRAPQGAGESAFEPQGVDGGQTPAAENWPGTQASERQRLLADLLYEGLQALDADRLLTPVDDNAHARFKRVLAYDPDNEIALQGLRDIVLRYTELAEEAAYRGLFDQAEVYLERARFVDADHPAIAEADSAVARERESGDLFFDLNPEEVQGRSDSVRSQLALIAAQAMEHQAFIHITAPSDVHARWIYNAMREAVDGYRLRGNIEIASRYSIRLRVP